MSRLPITLALLLCACGGPEVSDAGADSAPSRCVPPEPLLEGDGNGHESPLSVGSGEARAGRLAAGDVPGDPIGLSTVRAGDFVIANEHIAVVIEDVGDSDGFDPWGGKPVALAHMAGGALVELANFNESIPMMGRFIPEVRSVTVLADGRDGGAAVVRAIGQLVPIPIFDELFADLLTDDATGIEVAVDYRLAPDARYFEVDYTFRSVTPSSVRIRQPLHFFFQATRMPVYRPGVGFSDALGERPWIGFVGEGATSFAVRSPRGTLSPVLEISGGSLFSTRSIPIAGCALGTVPFAQVYVGGPGIDGLLAVIAADDGLATESLEGRARDGDGAPVSGVLIVAESVDGWLTRTRTAEDGTFALTVPAGAEASVSAWRASTGLVGPIEVDSTVRVVDVELPPVALLTVRVTDETGLAPLPARVSVLADEPPTAPARFGVPAPYAGRLHVAYATDGTVELEVPPGAHLIVVSRGYEYDVYSEEVRVTASDSVTVNASLAHVVPTPGMVCADLHLHTHRSIDAPDDARSKLAAAIAEGVEIAVRTEHEWVSDFEPEIEAMDISAWVFGFAGLEMTTFRWGHFGVFPMQVDPSAPNGGAVSAAYRDTPDVFAELRARASAPTIVINHPRTFGGLMGEGAYFDFVGYDPDTGTVERPELWDDTFGLIEVFNGTDFDANLDGSVRDWFSFLNAGRRVFALGASDSHTVRGTPVGYPRTCIELGIDDAPGARSLGASAIRDALTEGHAVVSGGIVIEAVARGGAGPGDEVTEAAERELVSVTVRAPTWIDADSLRVFIDGELRETIPIDDTSADPLEPAIRMRGDVSVPVSAASGTWVVFVAAGDAPLEPVHRGRRPFGVTNPIFLRR